MRKIQRVVYLRFYGGLGLGSWIETPLVYREVLPEIYFWLVAMAADAKAIPFLQF